MRGEQQVRLIARLQRLSQEQLRCVERFLADLEHRNSSPLFDTSVDDLSPLSTSIGQPDERSHKSPHSKDWPHAPLHRLNKHGTYIVTAGTLHKEHWFTGPERLNLLETVLLRVMKDTGWRLEAWAVFSNHYHFVAQADTDAQPLQSAIRRLHGQTSREVNRMDGAVGRVVWHNFWDTQLTFEKSYFARLNYVHQNAVKHNLVPLACQYRWCSAAWLKRTSTRARFEPSTASRRTK